MKWLICLTLIGLFSSTGVLANGKGSTPPSVDPVITADATATAEANPVATASANPSANMSAVIEDELQAPSTYVGASTNTAPCYYSNGFSVGIPGAGGGRHKSKRDEDCWALHEELARREAARADAELALQNREMTLREREMTLREREMERALRLQDECFEECQQK